MAPRLGRARGCADVVRVAQAVAGIGSELDDGIEERVHGVDAREVRVDYLER